ncbi:hypothetical protein VTP01DRAFT_4592 [Rhizomucor pusillus]|uniref:uncharacterized protein n=1 Tax=Rhizomucor pusillus TaxID=4840 RepID=UPI00374457F8
MSLYSSSKDVTLTTTETTLHIDEKQQPDRFLTPQPVRQNSAKSAMNRHRHQRLLLCNIPVKRRLGIHVGSDACWHVFSAALSRTNHDPDNNRVD